MKKTVGILSALLSLTIAVNAVTPAMSKMIRDTFSREPQVASILDSASEYDYVSVEEYSAAESGKTTGTASDKKETAYDDGKIMIYNFKQLSMIGSGKSYKYEDGVTAAYTMDAEYKIAQDISVPRHTLWKIPDGFKGKITGEKQSYAPLYDAHGDAIYLYNPYQLAVMAMDDRENQPVMSGDAESATFGTGKVVCTDLKNKHILTYSDDRNYVISAQFSSEVTEKPISVSSKKSVEAVGAKADKSTGAKADGSVGATADGRDFAGQVIKKIGDKTYILIGNEAQLRAIGSGEEVYTPVYQTHWNGLHHEVDTDSNNGKPIQLYGGDADLEESQNGYTDFDFHQIHDKKHEWTVHYFVGVNQDTGEVYTEATHAALELTGLEASWKTGQHYTTSANYIIFRNIDLGGSARPWEPLMFSGEMYGAKSQSGEKLWNGSGITDSTAITATAEANRPNISNVYVNTDSIYSDQTLRVNDFIGIGFFATISNKTDTSNFGVSSGTAIVKNIDLDNVHVENKADKATVDQTLLNAVTSGLGHVVGGLLDFLLRILSFGSTSTDLSSTLSNLLNARAKDPTIYATGAFAGRIYGDALVEDCRVKGTVEVSNVKDRTGGFVGYTAGITEYSGLSDALGATSNVLATILNAVPALGLGDLITILLDNALAIGDLVPTNYIAPKVNSCEVNGLTGDVGTATTTMAGGFVGQQIGTHIADCMVKDSTFTVKAHNYGGGFCGLERDAEIKGTLDGVGIDFSSLIQNIHPQSVIVDSKIYNCTYQVTGTDCIGGFVGAMTSSYTVDCTIDCSQNPITVHAVGEYAGGFAGFSSVGWQSNLGKDENNENSLLGTVKQLAINLLSSEDKSAGQNLLTLMGVSPSAILGCQVYSSELEVEADKSFAGGMVGKGEGIYIVKSDQAAYTEISSWNSATLKETPHDRPIVLSGLKSVTAHEDYAGGVSGHIASAAFSGLLNDVVGLGDFIGFTVSDVTVTGIEGGYTVKADNFDAGGAFGSTVGGTVTNVKLYELKQVEAFNRAAGFVGVAGPGELAGSNGLTVNLLGLNYLLQANNLLNVGQGIEVHINDCDIYGIETGYTVDALGRNENYEVDEFTAAGFIADSNSTKITDSHCFNLLRVIAADDYGFAGGFVGTSETGGLTEVADNDATSVKSLINADRLLRAIEYLLPEYTNCTTNFVDGGYVDADVAGGFAGEFASGTVDNSTIDTVNNTQKSMWTKTIKELYDPAAINATGDLQKQFCVTNIDKVHGRTYAGGFGGTLRSGALASAGGGLSILGDSRLGLNLDITNLVSVVNAYIPYIRHAGVYSENGFTVIANTVRDSDPNSGSAGGFGGFMSGAQISHSDVYRLKHTTVTPPSNLEAVDAPSYFNRSSEYAVTGGRYAGGYAGKIDIGSAASLGSGLKVLGGTIKLDDMLSALSVVVSTIEHSDVQGAAGGFSVIADALGAHGKVGKSGGFAGGIYGGHIQNSHCKNFYYIIGQEAAGGYIGSMMPGDAAKLLDDGSILDNLIDIDSSLASVAEDFVPTIRNSTTSCVPCGGAVRADAASDSEFRRGCAGGFCGYNDGGDIWGLNTSAWEDQNDQSGKYNGEQHICTAWRIRSVYGYEYAGGFTGFMRAADTAATSGIRIFSGLISVNNILSALSVVYPTDEHTAVYGPLRNIDVATWNAWVTYVGKYGGYGAELAQTGTVSTQTELDGKLSKYIYGCNVVAGRSANDEMAITEGGAAGGYVGYMLSGVITDGQSYDMKLIRAMRNAGGYAGKMETGGAATFGSVDILGLNLNLGQLVKAVETFVPTVKSGTVHGWQSGMTVESFGTDFTHRCGNAGGYVGSAYGAQIWGDKNVGNTAGSGCNITNLRYVRGTYAAGGYAGMATAADVADINTNSSDGLLQRALNSLISTPGNFASVMQATITTIRQASVNPDNNSFGFTVGGLGNITPHFAGGFAGSLEAAVIGSRKGESNIVVNGLRSVDGLYYAGGFVGLADVGSVASVSGTGESETNILLGLINAGSVDLLDVFRTYIYYSTVNGVSDGMVIRAYESAPEGILSEKRQSGCAGGFGGGIMNGTVTHSVVTNLNTVYGPNYTGGFIGHMGKNGAVDVDKAKIPLLAELDAGAIDVFGTTINECSVAGIEAGSVIMSTGGADPVAGGFSGYTDDAQIKNSRVTNLKQVYSDQIAGGFVGKTNMSYLVSAEVDSAVVQIVLKVVNALVKALYVPNLEQVSLIDFDTSLIGLKLLSDGDLLYVNLLGLRVGVSLVKSTEPGVSDTALITIGDSTVALPCDENGIDLTGENAEVVVNLIKANRTRVENCSVTGIDIGYDVYGGGSSNKEDGTGENGYAGGFVGYNNEGKFTSNRMVYCDAVRGTSKKVGPFSGGTRLESVYSFNTLASIEKVEGEENIYSVYRDTDLTYALTGNYSQLISEGVADDGTNYKRFDVIHLAAPISPGTNEEYYKIFGKWDGAKLSANLTGEDAVAAKVYVSNAKAVLMSDTPTFENDESLIPNPGESKDPCENTIDLTIQKIWNDQNNKDESRPESIKVRIWQQWFDKFGSYQNEVLFTDSTIIPDIDAEGWFTINKNDHGRAGSATWTRVIKGLPANTTVGDSIRYYGYVVEEAPILGYNSVVTYDESGSTATATITNTPSTFEIVFKYYDRYEIDGKPSGIEDTETEYTVPVKNIPDKFLTYDNSHTVTAIDFSGLIGEKAVEFSENALNVDNVMCDYDLWTSQSAAVSAMAGRTYFVDGNKVSYGKNTEYHTDYLGKPNSHEDYSGQEKSRDEKWVNYYQTFEDPDAKVKEYEEAKLKEDKNFLKVNKIVVWCYNYPRTYNVDIYGADSADDVVEKTVAEKTVYVSNAEKTSDSSVNEHKFYYNQRFGGKMNDAAQDAGGFIENYGLARFTDVLPEDYAEQSFVDYTFAYWAYNQEGTQIASVEREFWYRVTTDTKLYAVYSKGDSSDPGISISANENDTFVDASGVSRTRLNILGSIYGASQYDSNINKLSFVNISLSTQIRDNPQIYTPEKVNALFEQYKNQLKEIVKKFDDEQGSKPFTSAETYDGDIDADGNVTSELKLTLTTKGYIYTVLPKGKTGEEGESTTSLTNKNRVQFTMVYKTSALNINNTGSNGDTCLMYCAALKYKGEWSVSSNCLIYYNGEVVDNTANKWK